MKNFLLISFLLMITFNAFAAEVYWSIRKEGNSIQGALFNVEDDEFSNLNTGAFTDVNPKGFIRFGIGEKEGMSFSNNSLLEVEFDLIEYSPSGTVINSASHSLKLEYYVSGSGL
ncbi:MAG TPA: hypothetical protein VFD78_02350, partial [Chitinophagaceae bacterium]|nr:hypothetical protein [Chitinophagaceae bacterium]